MSRVHRLVVHLPGGRASPEPRGQPCSLHGASCEQVDVLRSRIMAGAGRGGGGDGGARGGGEAGGGVVRAEAVRLYRSGGARAFYRGIGATLLRAGPVAGVLLPVNDLALEALSRRYAEQG